MSSDSTEITVLPIEQITYVKELYPRLRPDDAAIERYRDAIENLPPIVVARGRLLVDGFHRWQAHVREERTEIEAVDLGDITDTEIFNESIRRNASHGQQLSKQDKQSLAGKLWQTLAHLPASERETDIAGLLAVTERSVRTWTKDARAAEKDALKARVWDLWLDCHSERAIAEQIDVPRPTVQNWVDENGSSSKSIQPPESRQHFDVWQFATADKNAGQQSYFGAIPPQVVENLLWFYTEPGGTVVDLFAGSGTTIDVAKRMGRRVWASDIRGDHYSPHLPIHRHDATTGWPTGAPKKADIVLLDPPYWQQAAGKYSTEPGELAELDLDAFYTAWAAVIKACTGRTERIAYIISPTQQADGTVIDHATDMLRAVWDAGLTVERRIVVPYSTQQATGQQVTWARDNRRMLKLYRDLVIVR